MMISKTHKKQEKCLTLFVLLCAFFLFFSNALPPAPPEEESPKQHNYTGIFCQIQVIDRNISKIYLYFRRATGPKGEKREASGRIARTRRAAGVSVV